MCQPERQFHRHALAARYCGQLGNHGHVLDLAMRDVEIAIGAFALSQLSALRGHYAAERQGSTGAPGSSFVVNPYCVSIQNSDGGYMRKLASILVLLALSAMPVLAGVQNFNNVSLVDVNCSKKVTADPDAHTRARALNVRQAVLVSSQTTNNS